MTLQERLQEDLKDAMRAGDTTRRDTLRLAISALKRARIDAMKDLGDDGEMAVLAREVKQRRESIDEFRKGGREDLVEKEAAELAILQEYLPEQVSEDQVRERARQVIAETGASGPRDMGKVMPVLSAEFKGRADGRVISQIVTELLRNS